MNNFLLDVLAIGALLSGILVITSKNPVISVLFLISVFVNVAGYLVLIGVGFIGISYIIVYVGAVTVLFLFVIMMINVELSELNTAGREYTQNVPLAFIIGSAFFYELITVFSFSEASQIASNNFVLGYLTKLNSAMSGESFDSSTSINSIFNNTLPDVTFSGINNQQIENIGFIIYTHGAIWLILAGIILLLSMVAPIILSIKAKN